MPRAALSVNGVATLFLFLAGLTSAVAAPDVRIRFEDGLFRVEGDAVAAALRESAPEALFHVFVEALSASTPLAGTYQAEGAALTFRPKYPLSPGVSYRAVWRQGEASSLVEVPRPAGPPARVEHVYPSSSLLPENQLKFYLVFSAPMSRGEAYRRVRLLDDRGEAGELPFLEIDQELWDRDGRRLTLLFDPGRIKRGVRPREELGGALVAGRSYTLVVDPAWPDASGRPLAAEYRKAFSVREADREPVEPGRWRLAAPTAGSAEPLTVDFGEPLEAALAVRLIQVFGPRGAKVAGEASLSREETQWRFAPVGPWGPGRYELRVDTALEDLAGNRVGRAFDVDVFDRIQRRPERRSVAVPFAVRARGPAARE